MIEVLWHGRGGQGAFTAARLLGAAASLGEGKHALAFPSFGPERRGAPMRAFTKVDTRQVGDRSAISQADFVIYLDETLLAPGWESELKDGGKVLVNSTRVFADDRIICLDANGISKAILGREIPNTTFLAALAILSDALDIDDVKEAIRQYMAPKLHAGNIAVVDEVAGIVDKAVKAKGDCVVAPLGDAGEVTAVPCAATPQRIIPNLRDGALDPEEFGKNTCWEAGHLVSKNAGWRIVKPVCDADVCNGCLVCYMNCPDGTVYKPVDGPAHIAIDYDFCKGCGICANVCRVGAIHMVPEGADE